jgi:hypothetical protein
MRWRRIDVRGHEEARAVQVEAGWQLSGVVEVVESDVRATLRYAIECDPHWRTRFALIEANAGQPVRFDVVVGNQGQWICNESPVPTLAGAIDIDLGFTPMTNTLPIRRLGLKIGEHAHVRSAWLRFPELRFEALEQTYLRVTDYQYRYQTLVDGTPFTAALDIDDYGRVLRYEGLWEVEFSDP